MEKARMRFSGCRKRSWASQTRILAYVYLSWIQTHLLLKHLLARMSRITLYFLTLGAITKCHSKISYWGRLPIEKDIRRSRIAVYELHVMASNTYGLTPAASIRLVALRFRRQSALCTNGIKMHALATYIWKTTSRRPVHHRIFHRASGSKGVGLYVSIGHNTPKNATHLLTLCIEELIAPSIAKFYASKRNEFGSKASLCQQIADITGIDALILRGADPTRRTVAERMSWASMRVTSRIEDTAYCLMGLFNVFMPMLYGEGDRAFIRLQEEIMRQSEDYTIFAWKSAGSQSCQRGLLARSPSDFGSFVCSQDKMRGNLQVVSKYKRPDQQLHKPAALTSRGLLIALPLLSKDALKDEVLETHEVVRARGMGFTPFRRFHGSGRRSELGPGTYLALICRLDSRSSKESQILCIWLQKHPESGIFTRILSGNMTLLPEKRAGKFKTYTIYVLPSDTAVSNIEYSE
jgi:hypothetical protein